MSIHFLKYLNAGTPMILLLLNCFMMCLLLLNLVRNCSLFDESSKWLMCVQSSYMHPSWSSGFATRRNWAILVLRRDCNKDHGTVWVWRSWREESAHHVQWGVIGATNAKQWQLYCNQSHMGGLAQYHRGNRVECCFLDLWPKVQSSSTGLRQHMDRQLMYQAGWRTG